MNYPFPETLYRRAFPHAVEWRSFILFTLNTNMFGLKWGNVQSAQPLVLEKFQISIERLCLGFHAVEPSLRLRYFSLWVFLPGWEFIVTVGGESK